MMKFYSEDFEAWKENMLTALPHCVTCPDCNGGGKAECDHCGSEIDCELCCGDGRVRARQLLDWDFYKRVRAFEESMLDRWKTGQPLIAGTLREPAKFPHNPLLDLMKEDNTFNPFDVQIPKIVLCIPAGVS
jgi:hypothetical protein